LPHASGRFLICAAIAGWCSVAASAARGADVVRYTTGAAGGGRTFASGEIEDIAAGELVIRTRLGPVRRIPVERVEQIETTRSAEQTRGEQLLQKGQLAEALAAFDAALAVSSAEPERRPWMRRELLAQSIRCLSGLGRTGQAVDRFLLLARQDPKTHHFYLAPLAWAPGLSTGVSETTALAWLRNRESKTARLIGASWLLRSAHTGEATKVLRQLAGDADRRFAHLASAQLWRLAVAKADRQAPDRWREAIAGMPRPLRPGPLLVVARSLQFQKRREEAALAYLRAALLYPQRHDLAARGLLGGADMLEALGRTREAKRLRHELERKYPQTPAGLEAKSIRVQD